MNYKYIQEAKSAANLTDAEVQRIMDDISRLLRNFVNLPEHAKQDLFDLAEKYSNLSSNKSEPISHAEVAAAIGIQRAFAHSWSFYFHTLKKEMEAYRLNGGEGYLVKNNGVYVYHGSNENEHYSRKLSDLAPFILHDISVDIPDKVRDRLEKLYEQLPSKWHVVDASLNGLGEIRLEFAHTSKTFGNVNAAYAFLKSKRGLPD